MKKNKMFFLHIKKEELVTQEGLSRNYYSGLDSFRGSSSSCMIYTLNLNSLEFCHNIQTGAPKAG